MKIEEEDTKGKVAEHLMKSARLPKKYRSAKLKISDNKPAQEFRLSCQSSDYLEVGQRFESPYKFNSASEIDLDGFFLSLRYAISAYNCKILHISGRDLVEGLKGKDKDITGGAYCQVLFISDLYDETQEYTDYEASLLTNFISNLVLNEVELAYSIYSPNGIIPKNLERLNKILAI